MTAKTNCETPFRNSSSAGYGSAKVDPHPALPLVECASWCVDGDGHPNQCCREDQACWSPATYVDLSLHPVHREAGGDYPEQLGVMARRNHERTVIYVHLCDIQLSGLLPAPYEVLDHALHLTADEAENLAALLLESAKLVRSEMGPNGGGCD